MKKVIFVFIIFIYSSISTAQEKISDSIFRLYEQSSNTERLKYIFQLGTSNNIPYSFINKLSLEALKLTAGKDEKSRDTANVLRAFYHYCLSENEDSVYFYTNQLMRKNPEKDNYRIYLFAHTFLFKMEAVNDIINNKYTKTKARLKEVYSLFEKFGDSLILANFYMLSGKRELYQKKNSLLGIDYFKQAIAYFSRINDYNNLSECYIEISDLYGMTGATNKSTHFISKALELEDNISIKHKIRLYLDLAKHIYYKDHIKINKKQLFFKALKYAQYLESNVYIAPTYAGLSLLYSGLEKYDSAIIYMNKSTEYYKKVKDLSNVAVNYHNLFLFHFEMKKYPQALLYLDSALTIFKNKVRKDDIAVIYLNTSNLYSGLNDEHTASLYLDSISLIMNDISPYVKLIILDELVNIYKEKKDFKTALAYYEKRSKLSDSLLQIDSEEKIEEIFVKYKTKEKEHENFLLKNKIEKEKQKARITLYAFAGTFLMLIMILVVFVIFRKNTLIKRKFREEEILRKNAELKQKEETFKRLEKEKLLIQEKNKTLRLEKEIINQNLEARNNLLQVTNKLLFQQKQSTENILSRIKSLKPYTNNEGKKQIESLLSDLKNISEDNNWLTFEKTFTTLFPDFFNRLSELNPNLTITEKRTSAFIKMNLSTSEIREITNQSRHSIYDIKKRLRIKFGLSDNEELESVIRSL